MMLNRKTTQAIILTAMAGATMLFSGCGLRDNEQLSDEFARVASQEVANMSTNSSTMIGSVGSPTLTKEIAPATAGDTTYYDWKLVPYAWDAAIQSYVRSATFTNLSDGFERTRTDTVTFLDAGGNKLQRPTLTTVKTINHIRNVKRTKGGNELNVRVVMSSAINLTPDTTHVKNGAITGTYNGEQVGTGTITNVTRQRVNSVWQFPRSGNIHSVFPKRTYDVEYTGNGNATVTITNLVNDKTRVILIHVDER